MPPWLGRVRVSLLTLLRLRQSVAMKSRISGLQKYQGGNPLPWEVKPAAQMRLWRFCQRWGRNLPAWRFAIFVGQAKRLALNPPTSGWGRIMLAKRPGLNILWAPLD